MHVHLGLRREMTAGAGQAPEQPAENEPAPQAAGHEVAPEATARRRAAVLDLLAVCALAGLAGLLYSAILGLWWTNDDFFQMRYVLTHRPLDYTFRPAVWRELPFQMLTPLLFLSLHLDLGLFGLAPGGFYLHQLLALSLAAAAFYLLLRLWLPRLLSFAGGVLFLAGAPVAATAGPLMCRHYLEGAGLGLLSTWSLVCAVRVEGRTQGRAWTLWQGVALVSALLYLLASLAKEVFVPLVLVLLVLPEGRWRERVRLALPHLAALAVYIGYRIYMLGMLFGGYGWVVTPRDLPRLAAALPGKMLSDLAGNHPLGWAALAIFGAGALAGLALRRSALPVALVGAAVAVLPVLPVSTHLHLRYALVPWVAAVAAFVCGCGAMAAMAARGCRSAWPVYAAVVAACCAAGIAGRSAWAASAGELERMSDENRFYLTMPPDALLRNPQGPGAAMGELRWFKENFWKLGKGARWSYDDLYLCQSAAPSPQVSRVLRVWSYDPATRRMAEVTAAVPALCARHTARLRAGAPLEATFRYQDRQLFWRLGPRAGGSYAFLLGEGTGLLEVPPSGGHQTGGARSLSLRIRYESTDGWVTYSPELRLDFSATQAWRWSRRGAA
jgi:hypothetical protein